MMNKTTYQLWGDSIGQGVVYQPARGRYCLAEKRCLQLVRGQGIPVESHARMGATVGDGYAEFIAGEAPAGGCAVIEYGGNDCDLDWQAVSESPGVFHDGKTPLPEFGMLLRAFVRDVQERGLRPVLVLPPPLLSGRFLDWVSRGRNAEAIRSYLGDVEHIGRWHESYIESVRETARETGCGLLDLHTPFLRARDFPALMCEDGMHPNADGQELMARMVFRALDREMAG